MSGYVTTGPILLPMLAMMLLTFVVWVYMYVLRIGHIVRQRIHPQKLTTPDKVGALISEPVSYPAYNFRNLLELPVLFYALCLLLYVTGLADAWDMVAAWVFVALRVVHSAIHCTVNVVKYRFYAYFASALVLWAMLAYVVLRIALA
ncbi:MAG: MAPEG family protein [Woeseiaceae bacterium]